MNYEIHVKSIQGRTLQDVIFKRRAPDGKSFDTIARAREAELQDAKFARFGEHTHPVLGGQLRVCATHLKRI